MLCNLFLLSCSHNTANVEGKKDFVYEFAFSNLADGEVTLIIIPLVYEKDTVLCCTDICSLYYEQNINMTSLPQFTKQVYDRCKSNKPIQISKDYYDYLIKHKCIVEYDNDIDHLYRQKGVQGLLDYYESLNHSQLFFNSNNKPINYLVYLLWKNGYYIYSDDESGCWQIYYPTK